MRADLEQALAMIIGRAPLDGALFSGGPWRTPRGQIEVYREQYLLRLRDALDEDLPGTRALLGEAYDEVVGRYLAENPPDAWTLARVADRLARWLRAGGAPPAWVDMAELDQAVQRGFVAADLPIPEPAAVELAMATGARWALQPHVALLKVGASVHLVRADAVAGEPVRPVEEGSWNLVIYRASDLRMRHLELAAPAWAILDALQQPASLESTVDAAIDAVAGDLDQVAPHLQAWFGLFMERGLLTLCDRPPV